MEHKKTPRTRRVGWLELLLAAASVLLVLQIFPAIGVATLWALNPRNWPRTTWFLMNFLVVLLLIIIRFGPDLYYDWKTGLQERSKKRRKELDTKEAKEQRRILEEAKGSRRRRIY